MAGYCHRGSFDLSKGSPWLPEKRLRSSSSLDGTRLSFNTVVATTVTSRCGSTIANDSPDSMASLANLQKIEDVRQNISSLGAKAAVIHPTTSLQLVVNVIQSVMQAELRPRQVLKTTVKMCRQSKNRASEPHSKQCPVSVVDGLSIQWQHLRAPLHGGSQLAKSLRHLFKRAVEKVHYLMDR